MSSEAEELKAAVLALPVAERLAVAEAVYQSIDPDDSDGWDDEAMAEFERRAADLESGRVVGIPVEQMMRELDEKYG